MSVSVDEVVPGTKVKSDEGPSGTLTGDIITTGSGRLYVCKSGSGAYGFIPSGVLEESYDVDDSDDEPVASEPVEPIVSEPVSSEPVPPAPPVA